MFASLEFWEMAAAVAVGIFAYKLVDLIGGIIWIKLFGE